MKKRVAVLLIVIIVLLGCAVEEKEPTPVYVTFYSHNEESWDTLVATEPQYIQYRQNLLERLHIIKKYNATLNWQSDWAVLEAIKKYDKGTILESTNGKNIVRYMEEDLSFSVDPHAHLTIYNYADLAYLIEQLGGSSTVVGGLQYVRCGQGRELEYIDWREHIDVQDDGYIYGSVYPEVKWKPEIIAVPAFAGHWFDEFSSGVWRPGIEDEFYEHDAQNSITYVGQGYPFDTTLHGQRSRGAQIFAKDAAYIKELVQKIQSGDVPQGELYTASLFITDFKTSGDVDVNEGVQAVLEELQPYVERGGIIYADYETVAQLWETEYNSEPNTVSLDEFSFYPQIWSQVTEYCMKDSSARGTCGDGECDALEKDTQQCPDDCR